jgi:hypothetical protein
MFNPFSFASLDEFFFFYLLAHLLVVDKEYFSRIYQQEKLFFIPAKHAKFSGF